MASVIRIIMIEHLFPRGLGRRGGAAALLSLIAIVAVLPAAGAHEIPRTAIRELVRLQGHFLESPSSPAEDSIELQVQDRSRTFRIEDRQVFVAVGAAGRPTEAEPSRLVLRGERRLLARLARASAATRVTLLGERRPGASELFLAAVDLCPEPPRE